MLEAGSVSGAAALCVPHMHTDAAHRHVDGTPEDEEELLV